MKPDFHRPEFFGRLELEGSGRKNAVGAGRILPPVLLTAYFFALIFLCFWNFGNLGGISRTVFGIPTDKFVHFCMFLPFPPLALFTFVRSRAKIWKALTAIVLIFMAGCLIAAGTELVQGLTVYRSCDIADFRADATALAASSIMTMFTAIFRHRPKQ